MTAATGDIMLKVRGLSKRFRTYASQRGRVLSWLSAGRFGGGRSVNAVADVSLELRRGEALAVVGANGAGKSTLLKLIAGTLRPTTGDINRRGRVGAMLELGMGFHPDFTGRENIRLNGLLLKLSPGELRAAEAKIVAFSELDGRIDQPIRTYSTGMMMRLGYAVAAAVSPDVLVIDEVLAVGDARFQQKCFDHLRRFLDGGGAVLFVSHDPQAVLRLCDRAMLLERGRCVAEGPPADVLETYNARLATADAFDADGGDVLRIALPDGSRHAGDFRAIIERVCMTTRDGSSRQSFVSGSEVTIVVRGVAAYSAPGLTVGVLIRDRFGHDIFGTNSHHMGRAIEAKAGEAFEARFRVQLDLGPGAYTLAAALHAADQHLAGNYDWVDRALSFEVVEPPAQRFSGIVRLPTTLEIRDGQAVEFDRLLDIWDRLFGNAPARIEADSLNNKFVLGGAERTSAGWRIQRDAMFALKLAGPQLHIECIPPPAPMQVSLFAGPLHLGDCDVPENAGNRKTISADVPAPLAGRAVALRVCVSSKTTSDAAEALVVRAIRCE